MEELYKVISANPGYSAWAFGIVNVFWAAFLYFNKKRHERELIRIQQELNLDLERRKKVFEMKAGQYESYLKHIDAMHRRHQTDYQDVFVPIMNEFMASYLSASSTGDKQRETQATIDFGEKISRLIRDGFNELSVIRLETNSLRLTASDRVAALLDEITTLYEQLFHRSGEMMSNLVEITMKNNQELARESQAQLKTIGSQIQAKATALREAMRSDLKQI